MVGQPQTIISCILTIACLPFSKKLWPLQYGEGRGSSPSVPFPDLAFARPDFLLQYGRAWSLGRARGRVVQVSLSKEIVQGRDTQQEQVAGDLVVLRCEVLDKSIVLGRKQRRGLMYRSARLRDVTCDNFSWEGKKRRHEGTYNDICRACLIYYLTCAVCDTNRCPDNIQKYWNDVDGC
jgi:hypothetical protein